jgi:predicted dehydrogenase
MNSSNRRAFLQTAVSAAIATRGRILGANDRIQLGIVGIGGRGRAHVSSYSALPECRIVALADVNQAARERASAQVIKLGGEKPKEYSDMRELFADKEIDAVSIATPNHWHALSTIWACQAGKDVYIEKPASYNMFESRKMIEAARKYNRMVQVGSQSRSSAIKRKAMDLLKQGSIGQMYLAKGLCFKRRKSIGHKPDEPVPPGLDWSMFLGPAPMRPYNELRFAYNWHWFWDTGNGDIGNQGVHEMDIARWGMGLDAHPTRVSSTGGKYVYDDDQETPNTQMATFTWSPKEELMFEVRGLITGGENGLDDPGNVVGNLFFGSDGYMAVEDGHFKIFKGEKRELVTEEKVARGDAGEGNAPHMANFLSAIRSRNHRDLNAEIAIGALSADLCHMANIAYRVGKTLNYDAKAHKFDDSEANKLMTRPQYRAPYVVPDKV